MTMLLLADAGTNTTSAGPITLILPLAVLLIVLVVWYFALRRGHDRRPPDPKPNEPGDVVGR
jgi:hypothetical protein